MRKIIEKFNCLVEQRFYLPLLIYNLLNRIVDRKFILYIFLIKIRNEKEFFNNIYPAIFEIAIIKIPLARSRIHNKN